MNRSNKAIDWQAALINKPDFLKQAVQAFVHKALKEEFSKFRGGEMKGTEMASTHRS